MITPRRRLSIRFVCALALVMLLACRPPTIVPPPRPTGTPMPTAASTYAEPITNLVVAPDGTLWSSYGNLDFHPAGGGVRRVVQGQETSFGPADGLPNDNVQVFQIAPDGVVWAGAGCTLTRYTDQRWQTILPDCDLLQGNIFDLAFTPDGALWVATGFKLGRFDGTSWTVMDRLINSLAVAPDGTLWVSGWEGAQDSWFVAHLQGDAWESHNTVNAIGASVGSIVLAPDGALWGIAGTAEHTIVRFDGRSWARYKIEQPNPGGYLYALTLAPAGQLWAISDGGVVEFDGQQWQRPADLPTGVTALAFGQDGALWLATKQGITKHEVTNHPHP